jgi:hypothetical protein
MNTHTCQFGVVLIVLALVGCTNLSNPRSAVTRPSQNVAQSLTAPATLVANPNSTGSIQPAKAMHIERAAHAATLLDNGQVLITGGFGQGNNTYIDAAELYDPTSGDFSFTEKMAIRRCCHTATRLSDGRVLIAGGFNGDYLADAELYDPKTGNFTRAGSLTTPRMDHVAVLLDNGNVLLVGGVGTGWTFLASAELYDPATGTFTPTGDMTVARESHTITKLQDGRVLITGGHQGRHSTIIVYDTAELYDPVAAAFTPTGDMNIRRHKHDAVLLSDGRVLITGGSDERDDQGAYASAEIYNPSTGTFSMAGNMPTVRYKHIGTSLLLKNGIVLIAGGARNAIIFDSRRNVFSVVPGDLGTATLSRLFATTTLLSNNSVLITGGYGIGQNVSAQTWIYHP